MPDKKRTIHVRRILDSSGSFFDSHTFNADGPIFNDNAGEKFPGLLMEIVNKIAKERGRNT